MKFTCQWTFRTSSWNVFSVTLVRLCVMASSTQLFGFENALCQNRQEHRTVPFNLPGPVLNWAQKCVTFSPYKSDDIAGRGDRWQSSICQNRKQSFSEEARPHRMLRKTDLYSIWQWPIVGKKSKGKKTRQDWKHTEMLYFSIGCSALKGLGGTNLLWKHFILSSKHLWTCGWQVSFSTGKHSVTVNSSGFDGENQICAGNTPYYLCQRT